MPTTRALAAALSLLALAACGGEEPATQQEPASNPIEGRVAPARRAAEGAQKEIDDSQARMEAQAREAAGEPSDTAR